MKSLFKPARKRLHNAAVSEIAARCAGLLLPRLRSKTAEMATPELRGYIRARAFAVVRTRVQLAVADGRFPAVNINDLTALVLERTVHVVVRDLQSPPIVTVPSPHVPLRMAA